MPARLIIPAAALALALTAAPAWSENQLVAPRSRVDESALRYYASQNQKARVEAETLRLKRLHPQWSPPQDLWTAKPGSADDAPLWELFANGKIDELRDAIAARHRKEPDWQPSPDLIRKMQRRDMRTAILTDAMAGRWTAVVNASPEWLADSDMSDVEVLWQIAEGFARTRRTGDARRVFEDILRSSDDRGERIATIQKALGLVPMAAVERLIDDGRRDAAGRSEFADIGIDITRARISAWLHDAPGKELTPAELAAFQEFAESSTDPSQPALLAWYAMKRNDLPEALEQFKAAIAKGGDATVAHGLAHVLRKTGHSREAEEVAYAWRATSAPNAILFIDILADPLAQGAVSIDAKRLARYAEVTLQTSSGEGAQALGWYAYNSCQYDAASEWFKRAVAWMPKETTVYGLALTLRRQKRTQDYIDIVNRYDGLFPKVVALMYPIDIDRTDPCSRPTNDSVMASSRSLAQVQVQVPLPSALARPLAADVAGPKRSEFPIAVALENPYRSSASHQAQSMSTSPVAWRPAAPSPAGLDARRVFGVGPMPYERYGKALLPGLNGITQPGASQDLALQAPRGTIWSDERAGLNAVAPPPANTTIGLSASAARFQR